MKDSVSIGRGKKFIQELKHHSSGFWLSSTQLRILADDLDRQKSTGVGFLVGLENGQFGVEILPLSGDLKPYETKGSEKYGSILGEEITISVIDNIKGHIETDIEIIHITEYSHEAQRFPPPDL